MQYASIDRQQPYATQHDMTRRDMHEFVASNAKKVDLPVQREAFLERGLIESHPYPPSQTSEVLVYFSLPHTYPLVARTRATR
jgi:hypothetical protein